MAVTNKPQKASSSQSGCIKIRHSTTLWKVKCLVSLLTGIILGLIPVRGIVGFISFLVVQSLAGQLYLAFMKLPDYVLDQMEALTAHILTSFCCFLVSWVLTYSMYNF
ncbi:uncharacterized protein BXIN_1314 [Babesia sp. Xinjiang]|uniref:uncharacterized protein n=1 Tax=Babesia sp. Xinjiang TaxID=462227 RepID=UPI000A217693|nr:uncharacterized protein BXIN_1314 [Babesia sp. Xinjiang]ORM40197.1 hypothetical protein BXIN_1314 [Babesia sp. Xinjiang]